MTAVAQVPLTSGGRLGERSDQQLVTAVRRGDDRAFELLYQRYQRRIHAYVVGMCKDHCRAEDITQEVFVSALRRMRQTECPIAFKAWIYEIAKNACIDAFRRSKRAEEISLQADEGFAPADYGRLVNSEAAPEEAVEVKQELDTLRGAFGGLSETHHQILVLRELEGLSYQQIGERLGMTRPAVESTLFRARRRLTEEYDELASGERCRRIQELFTTACKGRLGTRQCRRLARHVAHCQACRRGALAAGVDPKLLVHTPLPKRVASKVAGLLPFPGFWRGRGGGSGLDQLPMLGDQGAVLAKLGVAAVLVAAGVGAGVSTVTPNDRARDAATTGAERSSSGARGAAAAGATAAGSVRERLAGAAVRARGERTRVGAQRGGRAQSPDARHRAARDDRASRGDGSGGGGSAGGTGGGGAPSGGGGGASGGGLAGDGSTGAGRGVQRVIESVTPRVQAPSVPSVPSAEVPAVETPRIAPAAESVTAPVQETVDAAGDTVSGVTGAQLP